MDSFLKSFGRALPDIWEPSLIGVLLVFTILAWCIPDWRGNAVSSIFGFIASLAGIRGGAWLAMHPPSWARFFLEQLQIEAPQTSWINLQPHIVRMFLTLMAGGLAYVLGMALAKMLLRFWLRRRGANFPPTNNQNTLSPFH